MNHLLRGSLALAALLCTGCALTSKSDSVILRYFTPERAPQPGGSKAPSPVAPVVATPSGPEAALHLGKVNSASYIKDRIAHRDSEYEVGFYDEWRWTEKPESYVRRALARSLFEEHGIRRVVSGPGLVLDVDLTAFEEVRAPRHTARVEVTWMLLDARAVIAEKTLTVEHPLTEATPEAVTAAMAAALDEAIQDVVTEVVADVTRSASTPAATEAPASASRP